jgi:hypothetical protein
MITLTPAPPPKIGGGEIPKKLRTIRQSLIVLSFFGLYPPPERRRRMGGGRRGWVFNMTHTEH